MSDEQKFIPPSPVGEPFRADPTEPAPFTDGTAPATTAPASPLIQSTPPAPAGTAPAPEDELAVRPQFRAQGGRTEFVQPQPRPRRENERMAKVALGLGIASIMISPILGPVAIVLGAMSISRGEKKIGLWALATGIAGTVIGVVVVILVATGVMPSLDEMLRDLRDNSR